MRRRSIVFAACPGSSVACTWWRSSTWGEYCDLAHIYRPSDRMIPFEEREWEGVDKSKTILSVDTVGKSYSLPHLLPAGSYRLHLTISSSDTKPMFRTAEIDLSGQWYDNAQEMRNQGVADRLIDANAKKAALNAQA